MSAVADILSQVKRLTPAERAAVRDGVDKLVGRPVVKTPDVCGGDARIDGTRIPVWGLEAYRRIGLSDARLLEYYPTLSVSDLDAAWEYVSANVSEIEELISRNGES